MRLHRALVLVVAATLFVACGGPSNTDGGDARADVVVTDSPTGDSLPPDGSRDDVTTDDVPVADVPGMDVPVADAVDMDTSTTESGVDVVTMDTPIVDASDVPATDAPVTDGPPSDTGCAAGETACGSPPMCVNTATSTTHCGGCDRPCMTGETCMSGMCVAPCATGETRCGTACVNMQTDTANCGMCGVACMTGQVCTAGVCNTPCAMGETRCGGVCVNTQSSTANCGACGAACPTGQLCAMGVCRLTCMAPLTVCGTGAMMACVDVQTDRNNCGTCGRACAMTDMCTAGACVPMPPPNDTRAGAVTINLMNAAQTIMSTTVGANNNTTAACGGLCGAASAQRDVFYRFVLARREAVYADTFGASWDTLLFLQDAGGNNLAPAAGTGGVTCNDDTCGSRQSQISAVLPAGTYFLVLSGCNGSTGTAALHFQHLPMGATAVNRIVPMGMQTLMGTTAGANGFTSGCGGSGPELSYYWATCPTATATLLHAYTCGLTGVDTVLSQISAARATPEVCNNDGCGPQSVIMPTIPAGAGLHTFHIDGFFGAAGAVTAIVNFGGCAAGWATCGGVCRNLQTDAANCGACGRACSAGATCAAGVCSPPTNDTCVNSDPLTLGAVGTTTTVTGTTIGALNSANTCTAGNDVFYRFTLAQRELVYVDTFGSTIDTAVGFTPGFFCGGAALGCNDNSPCPAPYNLASQTFAVLDPGTYNIHVETPTGMTGGTFTLRVQHFAAPPGAPTATLPMGTLNVMGDTRGAPNYATSCGGTATPTRWYTWMTCPGAGGGNFIANTCAGTAINTVLDIRHSNTATATVCVDDTAGCGTGRQSTIMTVIPNGAGAHALLIRNASQPPADIDRVPGLFLIRGTRP